MKARDVRKLLGVTQKTLNNYKKKGILNPIVINSHHYDYLEEEVYNLLNGKAKRKVVTYARVMNKKQSDIMDRQNKALYDFATHQGYEVSEQICDYKCGMEIEDRKGLQKLMSMVAAHEVETIIVENRDRLVSFGFSALESMFQKLGTRIIVMSEVPNRTYDREAAHDMLKVVQDYSQRSNENRAVMMETTRALQECVTSTRQISLA